jgi:hypothetical protein
VAEHRLREEVGDSWKWKTHETVMRARLATAAQRMFGDLAALLEWEVKPGSQGKFSARAEIPGYTTTLEWTGDITGLYQFFAWTNPPDHSSTKYLIDGRLKLGAILSEEEGSEPGDEELEYDEERNGPVF